MLYRIHEGFGKAIYFIGIEDEGICNGITLDELLISLYYFNEICKMIEVNFKDIKVYSAKSKAGFIATIRVYKKPMDLHKLLEISL
jgi:GTPase